MEDNMLELERLLQEIDKLDTDIEMYSEQYTPHKEKIIDYLSRRGKLLYRIGYLKGKMNM